MCLSVSYNQANFSVASCLKCLATQFIIKNQFIVSLNTFGAESVFAQTAVSMEHWWTEKKRGTPRGHNTNLDISTNNARMAEVDRFLNYHAGIWREESQGVSYPQGCSLDSRWGKKGWLRGGGSWLDWAWKSAGELKKNPCFRNFEFLDLVFVILNLESTCFAWFGPSSAEISLWVVFMPLSPCTTFPWRSASSYLGTPHLRANGSLPSIVVRQNNGGVQFRPIHKSKRKFGIVWQIFLLIFENRLICQYLFNWYINSSIN